MIPYGRQDVTEADIEAVERVLRSDWLTQGPAVPTFEDAVARYCGASFGVAVNSATSALHIACVALGLGPGDWLWTVPNTFVASANCGLYCGAKVDFVEIDGDTFNMSANALRAKLVDAERRGVLPKVVIPVAFAGQSCDLRSIRALADEFGFRVIEDASHAVGGRYLGQPVGCGAYADVTVFSFHPVKIITTGEGGMALTNDAAVADSMRRLRSHGITRDPHDMVGESDGPWFYQQIDLGFNYRLTDIQAALGASQMARIDHYVDRRHALATRYDDRLRELSVGTPFRHPDAYSAFHLYVVQLDTSRTDQSRRSVFERMRAAGVGVNVHYIPVHLQPYYRKLGFATGMYPAAERYYDRAITLPLHPQLTEAEQDTVVDTLRAALQ